MSVQIDASAEVLPVALRTWAGHSIFDLPSFFCSDVGCSRQMCSMSRLCEDVIDRWFKGETRKTVAYMSDPIRSNVKAFCRARKIAIWWVTHAVPWEKCIFRAKISARDYHW